MNSDSNNETMKYQCNKPLTYFIKVTRKLNNIIECGFLVRRNLDRGHKEKFLFKLSLFDVCIKERMLAGEMIYCTIILSMVVGAEKQCGNQKEIAAI